MSRTIKNRRHCQPSLEQCESHNSSLLPSSRLAPHFASLEIPPMMSSSSERFRQWHKYPSRSG